MGKKTLLLFLALLGIIVFILYIARSGDLRQYFVLPQDVFNSTGSAAVTGGGHQSFSDIIETPTPTPVIKCTPPPCLSGEVYYCPGECIWGCGTVCATPTPS